MAFALLQRSVFFSLLLNSLFHQLISRCKQNQETGEIQTKRTQLRFSHMETFSGFWTKKLDLLQYSEEQFESDWIYCYIKWFWNKSCYKSYVKEFDEVVWRTIFFRKFTWRAFNIFFGNTWIQSLLEAWNVLVIKLLHKEYSRLNICWFSSHFCTISLSYFLQVLILCQF